VLRDLCARQATAVLGFHLSIARRLMIPPRALLLMRLLRSGWSVAAISLLLATLLEWGLITEF